MKNLLLPGLGALLLLANAWADNREDRRGNDRRRENSRVILYQHADFRGDAIVLYPGDAIDNMSGLTFDGGAKLNDSISSIRVEGNVEVFAYENSKYRGEALRLTENSRDLTGRPVKGSVSVSWNDRISSLRVERTRGRDREPAPNRPWVDSEKVIKATFNDLLGREPTAGEMRDFKDRLLDQGWNERMLREHLRTEEPYRTEAAESIVRQAYRDVLGREADPGGLRQYTWAVREKGWTGSDVKDDLRKSAEYRNRPR